MPYYQFVIHGSDVRLAAPGLTQPIVGFFTTKRVRAGDPVLAQRIAVAEVLRDWVAGAKFGAGGIPKLVVESLVRQSVWRAALTRKPGGYTFYLEDPRFSQPQP